MGEPLIRDARPGDGEGLARIWVENAAYYVERFPDDFRLPDADGLAEWFEELLAREWQEDRLWVVAEVDGEIAGHLGARIELPHEHAERQMLRDLGQRRMYINALGTAERYQRRGVAARLVEAAEAWGRERGAEVASTDTYLESPVSIPFWERRMGYRRRSVILAKRLG